MNLKWDKYFISLAYFIALRSKDESTKCGAVIVDEDNIIRSTGYNSFVRGIQDNILERQLRPEKYLWFEHAERNAVYNSIIRPKGCKIYVTGHPCARCASAIIQSGIIKVIYCHRPEFHSDWNDDIKIAKQMFNEANIEMSIYTEDIQREIYKFTRGVKHQERKIRKIIIITIKDEFYAIPILDRISLRDKDDLYKFRKKV